MTHEATLQLATRNSRGVAAQSVEEQRAVAEIQVKMLVAQRFPRNEMQCLDRILQACTRKSLAEVAIYSYPRGDTVVEGPSIRLLEVVAQNWHNIEFGTKWLSSDADATEVEVFAHDLETNVRESTTIRVKHERATRKGTVALTDPRDIYEAVANYSARRKRACLESVIPGDVLQAAFEQCKVTQQQSVGAPEEAISALKAAFAKEFGVSEEQLAKRLRHGLKSTTAAEVLGLRRVFQALRDGMGKIGDYFEVAAPAEPEPAATTQTESVLAKAREVAARMSAAHATPPEPANPGPVAAPPPGVDMETGEIAPAAPAAPAKPARKASKPAPVDPPFDPAPEPAPAPAAQSGGLSASYPRMADLINTAETEDELVTADMILARSKFPPDQQQELKALIGDRRAYLMEHPGD